MKFFMWLLFCFVTTILLTIQGSAQNPIPSKKDEKRIGNPGDVPVIQPKRAETDVPIPKQGTIVANGDQALLPLAMIRNKIESLKPGNTAYVSMSAFKVDARRRCWLHPHYITGASKSDERQLQISRDSSGFHVILPENHQWDAEDITDSLLPVRTITVKE